MRRFAGRLALGLVAFVPVGWVAGALWTAVVGSSDLEGVREVAKGRSEALTAVAQAVTWAGSALVLVPIAVVCCPSSEQACAGGHHRRLMTHSSRMRSHRADRALVTLTSAASYSRLWLFIAGVLAASGRTRARRAAAGGLVATVSRRLL